MSPYDLGADVLFFFLVIHSLHFELAEDVEDFLGLQSITGSATLAVLSVLDCVNERRPLIELGFAEGNIVEVFSPVLFPLFLLLNLRLLLPASFTADDHAIGLLSLTSNDLGLLTRSSILDLLLLKPPLLGTLISLEAILDNLFLFNLFNEDKKPIKCRIKFALGKA